MWSSNEEMRERKMIALADRGYLQQEEEHKNGRKFFACCGNDPGEPADAGDYGGRSNDL